MKKKKTLWFCAISNLQFNASFFVTVCPKNMQNWKWSIKHQPIVQLSSSLGQCTSFSLTFWWTPKLTILGTSWLYATLVKMSKIVILTHVACGQLVTNMVHMGVYQKYSDKISPLVQTRAHWLVFYIPFPILHVLGTNSHKKRCLKCKFAIAQNHFLFFSQNTLDLWVIYETIKKNVENYVCIVKT